MSITLTPSQERAIEDAIRSGRVRSVDEFITTAIEALPSGGAFNLEKAREAGARIRELRNGVRLERGRDVLSRDGASRAQILIHALVLDVSACMPWCCEDETTPASEEILEWAMQGGVLHVPALWLWEIVNVTGVTVKRRRITADLARDFLGQLAMLNVRVEPPPSVVDLLRLQALAERHALTAYRDAENPASPGWQ